LRDCGNEANAGSRDRRLTAVVSVTEVEALSRRAESR